MDENKNVSQNYEDEFFQIHFKGNVLGGTPESRRRSHVIPRNTV
jgi:hypothetical protein